MIASQEGTVTPFTLAPRASKARRKKLGNDGPQRPTPTPKVPPRPTVTEKHSAPNRPAPNHPWKRRAVLPAPPTLP
jgi:hypothetical protein